MSVKQKSAEAVALRSEKGRNPNAAAYVAEARRQRAASELEIDYQPSVSISEHGAWVAAWVWVDKEAVGFSQEKRTHTKIIKN